MKPFNICIIRPPGYIWSTVFHELAELIAYSLDDNGYNAQVTENYLHPTGQNLIIGCHLLDISFTPKIPRETIILNTEQVGAIPNVYNSRVLHYVKNFPAWDYSTDNISKFHQLGISVPRHLQIGYHQKLNRISVDSEKDIDILFYGSLNDSRENILDRLEEHGLKLVKLFGVFGSERDSYISRSKIVLNIHMYDNKVFEIIRVHYLMNNNKVILSQFDEDTKIDEGYKNGLILSAYDDIVDKCIYTLKSEDLLKEYEQKSLETIMRFDSVKIIGDLISA